MKKLLFFTAIIMAMFFTSCLKKDACCGQSQNQNDPPEPTYQVVGYDAFYGEVHDCPSTTGNIVEVWGANCNLLGKFNTETPSLMYTLNGWNYRDCGPSYVTVAADLVALVDFHGNIISKVTNKGNYRVIEVRN